MHDPGEARRLALKVGIVLLKIVSGAFLLALGRESKRSNLSAQEDPYPIQVGTLAGGLSESAPCNQQHDCRCGSHRVSSSQPALPLAIPSRNAANPQSLKMVPSGNVAVLKYPRFERRLLGMTLT